MVARFVGVASILVGLGLAVPAIVGWQEQGAMSAARGAVLVAGGLLIAGGGGLFFVRGRPRSLPASVRGAVLLNSLFLALLALEASDSICRRGGGVALSLFVFPLALLLFWGMLAGHRWAWRGVRWGSLVFALLYFGVSVFACVLQPADQRGPKWIWIASVGIILGSLLLVGGFYALGRPSARRYFGAAAAA